MVENHLRQSNQEKTCPGKRSNWDRSSVNKKRLPTPVKGTRLRGMEAAENENLLQQIHVTMSGAHEEVNLGEGVALKKKSISKRQ